MLGLIALNSYGQSPNKEAEFKYGNTVLMKFLLKKLSEERKSHDINVCLISATFAKFNIDTLGNIKDLVFYENRGTPPVFKEILRSIINSTSGLWLSAIVNGKKVESKPFILPLIYEMEDSCREPVNNGTTASLLGFLDFKDSGGNNITQLDCILLSPLQIFSKTKHPSLAFGLAG